MVVHSLLQLLLLRGHPYTFCASHSCHVLSETGVGMSKEDVLSDKSGNCLHCWQNIVPVPHPVRLLHVGLTETRLSISPGTGTFVSSAHSYPLQQLPHPLVCVHVVWQVSQLLVTQEISQFTNEHIPTKHSNAHFVFCTLYSAAPGDYDHGVLPMLPDGLIGIIHYAKSMSSSERQSFYLPHFAAL